MARIVRNTAREWLRSIGVGNPDAGLNISDTLTPVVVLGNAQSMVPQAMQQHYSLGPNVTAVVGGRAIIIVTCNVDTIVTGCNTDTANVRLVVWGAALLAILKGNITTQASSTVSSLGGKFTAAGVADPTNDAIYGTVTVSGDDGFLLPVGARGLPDVAPVIRAGEGFGLLCDDSNTAASMAVSWIEAPVSDIAAQRGS